MDVQRADDVGGITIVDDVAYVSGQAYVDSANSGTVHALNASTREVLWTFIRASSYYGMNVKPAVENGTVYVTSDDGYTYALDADTGEVEWSRDVAGTGSRLHSPVVKDGVVYVDDAAYGSTDANLYALDATDGSTIWSTPANVDGYTGSSPALANDTLYFTADGSVQAVDATGDSTGGDRLWSTSVCTATRYSPVYTDGVVYVPTTDSAIRAYDADTGDLLWRYDSDYGRSFTPAVVDSTLYATGLENDDGTYPLLALEGGTTDEPKTLLSYSGLSTSSTNVSTGESFTVSATVQNLADASCGYVVDFEVNGTVVDTATGSIGTGYNDEETVEFTHSFSSTGTYGVTIADLPPVTVQVTEPEPEKPDVDVSPSNWDYGTVDVDEWVYNDFEVTNLGRGDLHWNKSVITGPDADEFSITMDDSTKYAYLWWGGSGYVRVYIAPETPGTKTAALEIHSDDPDEPVVTVPLSGNVSGEPDVDVAPETVDFGAVEVGENVTANVTVSNVGGGPLTVDDAAVTGPDAGVYTVTDGGSSTTVAAGESSTVTLKFAPTATGSADATLELLTDDPDEPSVSVALSGNGTITNPNHAPIAAANYYTTIEGQNLTVDAPGVLANDYDPDGDSLIASNYGDPSNGTASMVVNGKVTYTPDPGFTGTDSFTYIVQDDHGEYSSSGTITVEVLPDPNRAPVAVSDSYSIVAGGNLTVDSPGVLANDYDPDGDSFIASNYGSPSHGNVSMVVNGKVTYVPDPGFIGTDSFTYIVRDEHGEYSSSGTITVEVLPDPNRAPVVVDDRYSIVVGENLTVDAPGVLANDYDPDGDSLIASNYGDPSNGTASMVVNGKVTYTPDPGFTGTDSFTYIVRDEHGEYSSSGTITVEVVATNRAPTAVNDHYATLRGQNVTVDAPGVLANDYDPDNDSLIASNFGSPSNGTASMVVNGAHLRPGSGVHRHG
ncbi:Ig-like domain-containing protein [Saliphagus sp. GCM10025308]